MRLVLLLPALLLAGVGGWLVLGRSKACPRGGEVRGPGGMCRLPAGDARIGTSPEALAPLLAGRPAAVRGLFAVEQPAHRRSVAECWIDRTEVTNAQYLLFLQEEVKTYVCDGRFPTVVDVAGYMLAMPDPHQDDVAWRQLAEGNREALWKALPDLAAAREPWPLSVRDRVLPTQGLTLTLYRHRVPDDWPGLVPRPERLGHPVRYVRGSDARAFAAWAGKRLPTEVEWEYAARGPDGRTFPWGEEPPDERAERCNWGAKIVDPKTGEASTWVAGSHPQGASWVGALDLVGNVAEWTDSGFYLYPGASGPELAHDFLGARSLRILRGGTAVDQEVLVLRPAARNFLGTGFNSAPPYLENRYAWVGFRCAWSPTPGANQALIVAERIDRGGRVRLPRLDDFGQPSTPGDLDLQRLAGTVAENHAGPDEAVEDGVWVKGRARAVLAIPCRSVLDEDAHEAWSTSAARARTTAGLLRASESEDPLLVLGAFHTDLPLPGVLRRDPLVRAPAPVRRGRLPSPTLVAGTCPPGTYLLALWQRRLCLCDSARAFQYCLTPDGEEARVEVRRSAAGADPACSVRVDVATARVHVTLALLLAQGARADPALQVVAAFDVAADAGEARAGGRPWR